MPLWIKFAQKKLITIKEKNNLNAEFNSPEPRTCLMFMAVPTEDRDKRADSCSAGFFLVLCN